MKFREKVLELHAYIEQWSNSVREEFKLTTLPAAMVANLTEPNPVIKIRDSQRVAPGFYQSRDGQTQVQVITQDVSTGLLVLELQEAEFEQSDERYQTMSPAIFSLIFEQADSGGYNKAELVEIIKSAESTPDSVQKQQNKDRAESFTWTAVSAAHGQMAQRYSTLFESVLKENQEEVKTDYLEFLFLAFILGARLGFSPRHDFRALYSGVFSLSDRTSEQCEMTRQYYDDLLVETKVEEFRLYDPILEQAPPVVYYVTVSAKDQVGLDKVEYPQGCFLPSRAAVSKLLSKN